jgi:hypothetical protein
MRFCADDSHEMTPKRLLAASARFSTSSESSALTDAEYSRVRNEFMPSSQTPSAKAWKFNHKHVMPDGLASSFPRTPLPSPLPYTLHRYYHCRSYLPHFHHWPCPRHYYRSQTGHPSASAVIAAAIPVPVAITNPVPMFHVAIAVPVTVFSLLSHH